MIVLIKKSEVGEASNGSIFHRGELLRPDGVSVPFVCWEVPKETTPLQLRTLQHISEFTEGTFKGKPQLVSPAFRRVSSAEFFESQAPMIVGVSDVTTSKGSTRGELIKHPGRERIKFVCWEREITTIEPGQIYRVSHYSTGEYRGAQQIIDPVFWPFDDDDVGLDDFRAVSPHERSTPGDLFEILKEFGVDFDGLRDLCEEIAETPAAQGVHHAYSGGLIEHTRSMILLAKLIHDHYRRETYCRGELEPLFDLKIVLLSILFHDIGKAIEYGPEGFNFTQTTSGKLIGHICFGVLLWNKYSEQFDTETVTAVTHCILSHHGRLDWGSPIVPQTPEAVIVHQIDLIDSRVGLMRELMKTIDSTGWSEYSRYFDGRRLYAPAQFTTEEE